MTRFNGFDEGPEQIGNAEYSSYTTPPLILGSPYDQDDLMDYIQEPGELPRHMRDPLPSEIAYR